MQSEFDDTPQDDLKRTLREFLNPGSVPVAETPAQLQADKLRVAHLLTLPADRVTADDNAFLKAQILAGIRGGLS